MDWLGDVLMYWGDMMHVTCVALGYSWMKGSHALMHCFELQKRRRWDANL